MPRVRVPKSAGDEITITPGGGEPHTYKVGDDGTVTVAAADLPLFLAVVDGAAEAKPASNKKD